VAASEQQRPTYLCGASVRYIAGVTSDQMVEPTEELEAKPLLWGKARAFFAAHPIRVIAITAGMTALVAGFLLLVTDDLRLFDVMGLFATVWALLLALAIYLITSGDTDRLVKQSDELREQLETYSKPPQTKQSTVELNSAVYNEFKDHVKRLRDKYPMPVEAITYAGRPVAAGSGNRPVIFETQRGHRYSVYKGRYWSVQRLDEE